VRHQSRQWIIELLLAANGKHLSPKQVFDAQTPPMNMNYPAIRKLMREMLRGGLRRDNDGYYLIKGSNLTEKEINTAHQREFYEEAKMLIGRHRRQRHTVATDFIWGLEELLKEERAKSKSKQKTEPESHSEIESDSEN
jgi:hypothetical protein